MQFKVEGNFVGYSIDCIAFLKKQKALLPLTLSEGLNSAAKDHAVDIGNNGIAGHAGSDGSDMTSRIERYGEWMGHIGENISFGEFSG